jgi:hypothetical protein
LTADNVFEAVCMGFKSPPESCSFVEGRFKYIKELDERLRKHYSETRRFHLVNILILAVLVIGAGFVFNCVFGKMFKKIMHERVNKVVED